MKFSEGTKLKERGGCVQKAFRDTKNTSLSFFFLLENYFDAAKISNFVIKRRVSRSKATAEIWTWFN